MRTLRRRAASEPWRIAAVAAASSALADAVASAPPIDNPDARALAAPLRRVAELAAPMAATADPVPSSWPWQMRHFYNAALDALAESTAAREGSTYAPLCHLWRLYESWVASETLRELSRLFGQPTIAPHVVNATEQRVTWRARWIAPGLEVDLWSQPRIDDAGLALFDATSPSLVSVSSELIPDGLVAVRERGTCRVVVVDAKWRGRGMGRRDAATEASKYLWGVRSPATGSAPGAIDEVVLVAPNGVTPLFDAGASRIRGLVAAPPGQPLSVPASVFGR